MKYLIFILFIIYNYPLLSQVTWIGTLPDKDHYFISTNEETEILVSVTLAEEIGPELLTASLQGTLIVQSHQFIAGKGEMNSVHKFPLIFVSREENQLIYKSIIPSEEISVGRYDLDIIFQDKFTGDSFRYQDFHTELPKISAGSIGIVSAALNFNVQGIDIAKKYGIVCPENTTELLPVLLEGVYTHGFCSDEIARLENFMVHLWMHHQLPEPELFITIGSEKDGILIRKQLELLNIPWPNEPVSPYFPNTTAISDPETVTDRLYGTPDLAGHLLELIGNQPGIHTLTINIEIKQDDKFTSLLDFPARTNFDVADAPTGADCQAFLLPIEMVDFDVFNQETQVYGYWVVALEINCEHYVVEKSKDVWNWISVYHEDSKGIEGILRKYEFIDHNPWPGTSYYRIKQVDFDGTLSYSRVLAVHIKSAKLRLFPNPVTSHLQYFIEDPDQSYDIKIFDQLGSCVVNQVIPDTQSAQNSLDLSELPPGIYYIKFTNRQNYLGAVEKFIKL